MAETFPVLVERNKRSPLSPTAVIERSNAEETPKIVVLVQNYHLRLVSAALLTL